MDKCVGLSQVQPAVSLKQNFRANVGMCALFVFGLSGCILPSPYSNKRDQAPVEVRRGEAYGIPSSEGLPAPQSNRPVYIPDRRHPAPYDTAPERSEPYDQQAQERREDAPPPAVARLVIQAEEALKNENYSLAASRAESALRLDPQSISAYHTLARTYLFEGRFAESEQMALRALSFIRNQSITSGRNTSRNLWLLIAETRRNRSDHDGAERAMERAGGRH